MTKRHGGESGYSVSQYIADADGQHFIYRAATAVAVAEYLPTLYFMGLSIYL